MEYTRRKFLLELENYFTNFPQYTIGEVLYSLMRNLGSKEDILTSTDEHILNQLEKTQFVETEN